MTDAELIKHLGGPTKVAELLNFEKQGGVQRVQNWIERGIPAQVKVDHPDIFLRHLRDLADPPELIVPEGADQSAKGV